MKKHALALLFFTLFQQIKAMDNPDFSPAQMRLHGVLMAAVFRGDMQEVQQHIAAGVPLNITGDWTATPLAIAASQGYGAICKLLLKHGADPNAAPSAEPGEEGPTALTAAIQCQSKPICKLLLEHGANPNGKNGKGEAALLVAISRGTIGICKLLIKYGAAKENNAAAALVLRHLIVSSGSMKARVPWQKKCTDQGREKLLKTCRIFIANSFEISTRFEDGDTPLIIAAKGLQEDVCRLFVNHQRTLNKSVITGLMCLRQQCFPLYQQRCVLKPYFDDHTVQVMLKAENQASRKAFDYLACDWLKPK